MVVNGIERYIITGAQAKQDEYRAKTYGRDSTKGAPNIPLIENIDNYSDIQNAETMILQMQGSYCTEIHMHPYFESRDDIHINKNKLARLQALIEIEKDKKNPDLRKLRGADYFDKTIGVKNLNDKLAVADLIVPPQNQNPMTGKLNIPQNQLNKSVIFAHSKQMLKVAPKGHSGKYPRLLLTTGLITHPNYNETNFRGDKARWDHQYGFVVAEIIDSKRYLVRLVPANKNGTFVDMGYKYEAHKKPQRAIVDTIVLGDIHLRDHDPKSLKASYEMIDYFQPKYVVVHDFFNGHSMNPHERDNTIKRSIQFKKGRLDIYKEYSECFEELVNNLYKKIQKWGGEIIMPFSNHPFFAHRYLSEGEFLKEPWNDTKFVSDIRSQALEGYDPIKAGLEIIAKEKNQNLPEEIHFLDDIEDFKRWGYQLGVHGHKGLNGGRGSFKSMKTDYGKIIMGHTHTPEVWGDAMCVGTNTNIPLDYNRGQPTTQLPANAIIYEGGLAQLLPIINGVWNTGL